MGNFHSPLATKYYRLPKVGSILDFGFARGLRAGTTVQHHHQGIDFPCPVGTLLYAIADGIVTHAHGGDGPARGFGGYGRIVVVHSRNQDFSLKSQPAEVDMDLYESKGDDLWLLHAHCDKVFVAVGESVTKGQLIAESGRTAFRKNDPAHLCGPHLHHELALLPYPKGLDRKIADFGRIHPSKFYLDNP